MFLIWGSFSKCDFKTIFNSIMNANICLFLLVCFSWLHLIRLGKEESSLWPILRYGKWDRFPTPSILENTVECSANTWFLFFESSSQASRSGTGWQIFMPELPWTHPQLTCPAIRLCWWGFETLRFIRNGCWQDFSYVVSLPNVPIRVFLWP